MSKNISKIKYIHVQAYRTIQPLSHMSYTTRPSHIHAGAAGQPRALQESLARARKVVWPVSSKIIKKGCQTV
jgi:hypothetical protein